MLYTDKQFELAEAELVVSRERIAELSLPPTEVPRADRQELLRMLDRRQHEISRLAEEWNSLSSQLEITSAKKTEFQTRLAFNERKRITKFYLLVKINGYLFVTKLQQSKHIYFKFLN